MCVYLDVLLLLNFGVDLLLILGTNRLAGCPPGLLRGSFAAAMGAAYAGLCFLPGFAFLGNTLWRLVSLGGMSLVAFGKDAGALRRGALFVFLSMALGGIALGLGNGGFWALLGAAAGVAGLCAVGFRGRADGAQYVPVELIHAGQKTRLTALVDTGNTLCDPITGMQVLVAGADVGRAVLGLTERQLADPVGTVARGEIPGLRLIPFRAVGSAGGLLLALRLDEVRINGRPAGNIVAFAPQSFGKAETYQALTGGIA